MRTRRTALFLVMAASLLAPTVARAQSDVAPPLPNVLILLDTSGSMERFPNGSLPTVATNATSTEKNRWVQALEVLGGQITGYSMLNVKRDGSTGSDFFNEYNLAGTKPYDADYYLPHFRPLSKVGTKTCTIGASSLTTTKTWPTDWNTWGVNHFGFRAWNGSSLGTIGSCLPSDFDTDHLGILDTFRDQARFGLMTFDTLPDPQTGWTGTTQSFVAGMEGQWSYYPGWDGAPGVGPSYGWPGGCMVDASGLSSHAFELGARNPSAPPWEGPLIPFAADDSTTALRAVNDRIRYAMLAARPFGATPLGPMLADAAYYLTKDPKGPKSDPVTDCRGSFIIVITDGFPNSDLRPNCEDGYGTTGGPNPNTPPTKIYGDATANCAAVKDGKGCCPAKRPQDITKELANPTTGKGAINTFVVGFAVSDDSGKDVQCETVGVDAKTGKFNPAICAGMPKSDPKYACCTLHEMAFNGGTDKALFANDSATLRSALIKAMSDATKKTSTSRTTPVFTQSASSAASGNGQYEFHSSFKVNAFTAWSGVLERVRWTCQKISGAMTPTQQTFDPTQGDDFTNNLNKQTTRRFWTIDSTSTGTPTDGTLRPNLATADFDGMGPTAAPVVDANGSTFVGSVSAAAMKIAPSGCGADATTANECKQKLLNYALALPQPKTTWLSREGNAMGDIYHATPESVGPPSSFLRDESYTTFRNAQASRIPMLLAATNDGILHAFRTDVKSEADAVELWGFIPPAVLPNIGKQYGGAHALLLDASPVVKDVAFGPTSSTTPYGRTSQDAKAGQASWRTVAVGGLTVGRGYYALDVTDPAAPKLLWQLTKIKDAGGVDYDLFGSVPGTPAIGTIYVKDASGVAVETPVAFLPGGEGTLNRTGTCARWNTPTAVTDAYTTSRNRVRCWIGAGNSLTIVRLYDGKILRSFRNDPAGLSPDHPAEPNNAALAFKSTGKGAIVSGDGTYAGIDSPITGAVALYPSLPGTVTVRGFVGDFDGTLWKIDVSDSDPQKWSFSIFHDAYFPADSANANSAAWGPVAVPPVVSTDAFGDIVVDYATGDQSNFSVSNLNHMYSITERSSTASGGTKQFTPKLNWHLKFPRGVTPTGPLSLFSSRLFFSTYKPDTVGTACISGSGTIWGVDYLEAESKLLNDDGTPVPMGRHEQSAPSDAALATPPCPTGLQNAISGTNFFRCINLDAPSIVFGAGVTQRPSCVDAAAASIGTDPYMGSSSPHSTVSAITQGDFQLVAQTGPSSTTSGGTGLTTNTYVRTLVPPMSVTRIDSWAAVIE